MASILLFNLIMADLYKNISIEEFLKGKSYMASHLPNMYSLFIS